MSDKQYLNALVDGFATLETRSERVLVEEVKLLRAEVAKLHSLAVEAAIVAARPTKGETKGLLFEKRELLVQDVIAATRALINCEDDHGSRAEVRTRVLDAARRLERWKP